MPTSLIPTNSTFQRHPRLWAIILAAVPILICLGIIELILRATITYSIDYYSYGYGKVDPGTVLHFPYGEIPINSMGFADDEFDLESAKERIGYFGDSVNFGLGAGYPHRVSEIVESAYPQYEHWNIGGGLGAGMAENSMSARAAALKLGYVIYLLNLNDVVPHSSASVERNPGNSIVYWGRKWIRSSLDIFRDKLYVYNFVRFKVKTIVQRWGFGGSGHPDYHLWPGQHEAVFKQFAERLNREAESVRRLGATFCVILLPEEMQVSRAAAQTYRDLGFNWDPDFEIGRSQEVLRKYIDPAIPVHDPLPSFIPFDSPVGTYFVYNKGDSIDWNHPTRLGHARIARSFIDSGSCPFLDTDGTAERPLPDFDSDA